LELFVVLPAAIITGENNYSPRKNS